MSEHNSIDTTFTSKAGTIRVRRMGDRIHLKTSSPGVAMTIDCALRLNMALANLIIDIQDEVGQAAEVGR